MPVIRDILMVRIKVEKYKKRKKKLWLQKYFNLIGLTILFIRINRIKTEELKPSHFLQICFKDIGLSH